MRTKRTFENLLSAARDVVSRWSSGDLAEAVRNLDDAIEDCERARGPAPRQEALELEERTTCPKLTGAELDAALEKCKQIDRDRGQS